MVYRVGLENRSRATDRGFESHPLRQTNESGPHTHSAPKVLAARLAHGGGGMRTHPEALRRLGFECKKELRDQPTPAKRTLAWAQPIPPPPLIFRELQRNIAQLGARSTCAQMRRNVPFSLLDWLPFGYPLPPSLPPSGRPALTLKRRATRKAGPVRRWRQCEGSSRRTRGAVGPAKSRSVLVPVASRRSFDLLSGKSR